MTRHHLVHIFHRGHYYGLTLDRRQLPFHTFMLVFLLAITFAFSLAMH
jgi:hypothetical protein